MATLSNNSYAIWPPWGSYLYSTVGFAHHRNQNIEHHNNGQHQIESIEYKSCYSDDGGISV